MKKVDVIQIQWQNFQNMISLMGKSMFFNLSNKLSNNNKLSNIFTFILLIKYFFYIEYEDYH